jgi:hypothetical protein
MSFADLKSILAFLGDLCVSAVDFDFSVAQHFGAGTRELF